MSWKSIVTTGLLCLIAAPVWAQPSLRVTPSPDVNANGNREWWVEVLLDQTSGALPSSLAIELAFTHIAGVGPNAPDGSLSNVTLGIVDNSATNTNIQASNSVNDTWYYKTNGPAYMPPSTLGGSDGNGIWVTRDFDDVGTPAVDETDEQNPGANPFTGTQTEGLYVNGANVFASLGSVQFQAGTTAVNALHIVTNGGGGVLRLDSGVIWQNDPLNPGNQVATTLAQTHYYVPGDFTGNGAVTSDDFNQILQFFGQQPGASWDGFRGRYSTTPVNGHPIIVDQTGVVTSDNFNQLLQNFGDGINPPPGGGGIVPEPTTLVLLGMAVLGFVGLRRR